MNNQQLIFVYNASSDLFSTVSDFAHKILSPSTYECQLCALTYGNFSIKQDWKSFLETFPIKTVFFHKDEFEKKYKIQTALPAVYVEVNGAINELIIKQEIDSCKNLEELKNLITQKLEEHDQHNYSNL